MGERIDLPSLAEWTVQQLANGTITIFLGAGASAGTEEEKAAKRGAPATSDLKEAIAKLANLPDSSLKSDLDVVATLAAEKLGDDAAVRKLVVERIGRDTPVLRIHAGLAALPFDVIMTTNYDHRYEEALATADREFVRIVRDADLPMTSSRHPRVYKLHGDIDDPPTMVLTARDYHDWESRQPGLIDAAVVRLQEQPCLFIGYRMNDPNLTRLLALVGRRLGKNTHRHYALTRSEDSDAQVRLGRYVDFVQGDATEFVERVRQLWEDNQPEPSDIPAARIRLEELKQNRDWNTAVTVCRQLGNGLRKRQQFNMAAGEWRRLGDSAGEDKREDVAARAYLEAGKAYLEGHNAVEAEDVLLQARKLAALGADLSDVVRDVEPLLLEARQDSGGLQHRLQALNEALTTEGEDSAADMRYTRRTSRSIIQELLYDDSTAIDSLRQALSELPEDAGYPRAHMRAALARVLMGSYRWDDAREVLDDGVAEVKRFANASKPRTREARALLDLVRANLHFDRGEYPEAFPLYLESGHIFEETDYALAITAWQGVWNTGIHFGEVFSDAHERLQDFMRLSPAHEEIGHALNRGVASLASGKLPGARSNLLEALEAAHVQHNHPSGREARRWLGRVLVEGGRPADGLLEAVRGGGKEEAQRLAARMGDEAPPLEDQGFIDLITFAKTGDVTARAAALVALRAAADLLPDERIDDLAELLSRTHELPSLRNLELREDAAKLARRIVRRLDLDNATLIVRSLVACIEDKQGNPLGHRSACAALAAYSRAKPDVASTVQLPLSTLANLAEDKEEVARHEALGVLVALGEQDIAPAREEALKILRASPAFDDLVSRARLRDVSENELTERIRRFLENPVDRVETTDRFASFSYSGMDHRLLYGVELPDALLPPVGASLIETVVDSTVSAPARATAARMLGELAKRLGMEARQTAITEMQLLVEADIDSHFMAHSTDDPLAPVQIGLGSIDAIVADVVCALLRLSPYMDVAHQARLKASVERLRSGRSCRIGMGIARGLCSVVPSTQDDRTWITTRLLLLLNSEYPDVRGAAAESVGTSILAGALPYSLELSDTIRLLTSSTSAADRRGGALALSAMTERDAWASPNVSPTLLRLQRDISYKVRTAANQGFGKDP